MNKRFYVYAIRVNRVVRYIGKGTNGRVHEHMMWVRLIEAGTKPRATFHKRLHAVWKQGAKITHSILLKQLSERDALKHERRIIAEYRADHPRQLWNVQPGGEGGLAEIWADPEWKAKQSALIKAALTTPEVRARRKKQAQRRWLDPNEIEAWAAQMARQRKTRKYQNSVSDGLKRKWAEPEYHAAMLIKRKAAWTATRRKARGRQSTAYWADQKNRNRQSRSFSRYWSDPKWKAATRAKQKAKAALLWADPIWRAKMLAARKAGGVGKWSRT